MREDQLARDIVANLARRFRAARSLTRWAQAAHKPDDLRALYLESECEAWNAYADSRRILFREEGANVL